MNIKISKIFLAIVALFIGTIFISTASASIVLISPADEEWTDETTPTFTFELSNLTSTVNCSLLINSSTVETQYNLTNGTHTFTTNLTEGKHTWKVQCGTENSNRTITVDITAPTIDLISPADEEVFLEDRKPSFTFNASDNLDTTLDCELYIDGDTKTEWSETANSGENTTISLSNDLDWGDHEYSIKCMDNVGKTTTSDTRTFYIGGLIISDIDAPDSLEVNEEDTITVTLENVLDEDIEDVEVTLTIDDLDIEETLTKDKIGDGDEKSFDFDIDIPCDADEDEYEIEISAEGKSKDSRIRFKPEKTTSFSIDRNTHDMCILSQSFDPSSVNCGSSVEYNLKLFNSGERDESDVYFVISNTKLNIQKMSEKFDIDSLDDSGTKTVLLSIPDKIAGGNYPFTVKIYYDDGHKSIIKNTNLDINCQQPVYSATITADTDSLNLDSGEEGEIILTLQNTGDQSTTYDLFVSGASTWATYEIIPSQITLDPDETATLTLKLIPKEDIEGAKTLSVLVKHDGTTLKSKVITVNVNKLSDVQIISEGENNISRTAFTNIGINEMLITVAIVAVVLILLMPIVITKIIKKK